MTIYPVQAPASQYYQELNRRYLSTVEEYEEDDVDSESLFSLTPSLEKELYRFSARESRHRCCRGGERKTKLNQSWLLLPSSPVSQDKFQSLNDIYCLPVGDHAKMLEDLHLHFVQVLTDGALYREPTSHAGVVEKLLEGGGEEQPRVLDLGCGVNGTWISAMAATFTESQCIGIDLCANESEYAPPNCYFETWDILEGLPYPDEHFSVIHTAFLTPFIPDFRSLASEIQRCLKPGGVLSMEECEATVHLEALNIDFLDLVQQAAQGHALPFFKNIATSNSFNSLCKILAETTTTGDQKDSAFEFVHEVNLLIPVGAREGMNAKEAMISSLLQKITDILGEMLEGLAKPIDVASTSSRPNPKTSYRSIYCVRRA